MFYEEHISLGLIDKMEGTRHFFPFFFCPELSLSSGKLRKLSDMAIFLSQFLRHTQH